MPQPPLRGVRYCKKGEMLKRYLAKRLGALAMLFVTLILTVHPSPTSAKQAVLSEAPQSQEYFYFPYPDCILGTIRAIEVQSKPKKDDFGCTELTVEIDDVLRGNLKAGGRTILAFPEPLSEIFPGKSKSELLGSKFVLAFMAFGLFGARRSITHIYSPFAAQMFSADDVANLKAKLQSSGCSRPEYIMATVKEVHSNSSAGAQKVTAAVNEILVAGEDSALRKLVAGAVDKDAVVTLWVQSDSSSDDKNDLKPIKAGMKCIWGYDGSRLDGNQCYLYNVTTPFPGNKFDDADVEGLRRKLKKVVENNSKLRAILQKYLEERWTAERIKTFCQPERRIVHPFMDVLQTEPFTLEGQLYPELSTEIGDIRWYCGVNDNVPVLYSISVRRKAVLGDSERPDIWNLEASFPGFNKWSDDEFVLYLVSSTLSECASNYERVNGKVAGSSLYSQASQVTNKQLIRDQDGRLRAYSCSLHDGKNLIAELDQNLSIKSILVNGKLDKDWTQALAQASPNIDKLNRKDEEMEKALRLEYQLGK